MFFWAAEREVSAGLQRADLKATMVAETLGRRVATPSSHAREPPSSRCEASLGLCQEHLLEEQARHLRPQQKRPLGQRIGGSENVLPIDAKSPTKWSSPGKLLSTSNNKENENDQVPRKAHEASPREEGTALTEALRRSPLGHRLGALCKLRQALASTIQGPVEGVLRSGGAELLVSVLSSTDSTSACRVEAAWCLVQLSCGSSVQTKQVAQAGATRAAMGALQQASIAESSELCECCLQLLANVANDQDPSMRDHLLFDDIVEVLGQLFGEMPGFSWTELQRRDVLLSLTRLMVALCRGVSAPLLERVECSLEFFCQVLDGTVDREMLHLALQGLCNLLEAYQDSDARTCVAALVSAGFNLKQAASVFQGSGTEALLAKLQSLGFQA